MSQPRPDFLSPSVAERIQLAQDIWDSIAAKSPESVTLTPGQLEYGPGWMSMSRTQGVPCHGIRSALNCSSAITSALFKQLATLTKAGYASYKKQGFVQ
jgi:hypothetical protein